VVSGARKSSFPAILAQSYAERTAESRVADCDDLTAAKAQSEAMARRSRAPRMRTNVSPAGRLGNLCEAGEVYANARSPDLPDQRYRETAWAADCRDGSCSVYASSFPRALAAAGSRHTVIVCADLPFGA